MKKISIVTALLAMLCSFAYAEEEVTYSTPANVNFGVGFGASIFDMREVKLANLMSRNADELYADYTSWHLDFTAEFLFSNESFSLGTGVRLTNQLALMDRGREDLYWLVNETATTCDYITINTLGQRNYYLGVPLSLRFFFAPVTCRVRPYLRLDGGFDFLVSSNNSVNIWNEQMERRYEDKVKSSMGKPDNFHIVASAAGGVRVWCNHFYVNGEFVFPQIQAAGSPISFIEEDEIRVNAGIKLAIQFPIGSAAETETVETSYSTDVQTENEMPTEDF